MDNNEKKQTDECSPFDSVPPAAPQTPPSDANLQNDSTAPQSQSASVSFYERYKKPIWIGIAIIVAILVFSVIFGETGNGTSGKYVYSDDYVYMELKLSGSERGTYVLNLTNKITQTEESYEGTFLNLNQKYNDWENYNVTGFIDQLFIKSGSGEVLIFVWNRDYILKKK